MDYEDLTGEEVFEVDPATERFIKVMLEHTKRILYIVDFWDAATANFKKKIFK